MTQSPEQSPGTTGRDADLVALEAAEQELAALEAELADGDEPDATSEER